MLVESLRPYPEIRKYDPGSVGSGEFAMLLYAPYYKRRYTLNGDYVRGCTIGCAFCYYRTIDVLENYIGTGRVRKLVSGPEEFAEITQRTKIRGELVLIQAGSDGSMIESEVPKILDEFEKLGIPDDSYVIFLRRAPFTAGVMEHLESYEFAHYGTTLTPDALKMNTIIDEKLQLERLAKYVPDPRKVSVEVGPITPKNFQATGHVFKSLSELGWKEIIYRGISVGDYGVDKEGTIRKFLELGIITEEMAEKARKSEDYYYRIKNLMNGEMEKQIEDLARGYGLKPYRRSPEYYREVWKLKIAFNRNNKVREWLYEKYEVHNPPKSVVENVLENLGYTVEEVNHEKRGVFRVKTEEPITEDVAMHVGEQLEIALLADNYKKSPSMRDVKEFYIPNEIVVFPKAVKADWW